MYTTSHYHIDETNLAQSDRPTVGLILLSTDMTCERDFSILTAQNNLQFDLYINRIKFANPMTEFNLKRMLEDLGSVAGDILPDCPIDTIVFGCTSASALMGDEAVKQAIQSSKPNATVSTTASAAVSSLQRKGYKKISLLAPYIEPVSISLANYFEGCGLDIASLTYMGIEDDRDVGRLKTTTIMNAAKAALDPSAEALFISCTAMRVVEIREELEQALGVPVFSSNYSTFWETMRSIRLA